MMAGRACETARFTLRTCEAWRVTDVTLAAIQTGCAHNKDIVTMAQAMDTGHGSEKQQKADEYERALGFHTIHYSCARRLGGQMDGNAGQVVD